MNPAIFWTTIGMVLYVLAEYASKRYAMKPGIGLYWLAVLPYWLISMCWMPVIKHTNTLAVTSVVWDIFYVLISIVMGVLIFSEKLTALQVLGMVFGAVAIVLLTIDA